MNFTFFLHVWLALSLAAAVWFWFACALSAMSIFRSSLEGEEMDNIFSVRT